MIAGTRVFWQFCGRFRGKEVEKLEVFWRDYNESLGKTLVWCFSPSVTVVYIDS